MNLPNNKKIILALVILLLLGGLAYLVLRNSPYFSTLEWKTYTNKEYGYEFKYPKDWAIGGFDRPGSVTIRPGDDNSKGMIIVGVGDNPEGLPLEGWLREKPSNDPIHKTRRDAINNLYIGSYSGSDLNSAGLNYINKKIIIDNTEGVDLILTKNENPMNRSIVIHRGKKVYILSGAPIGNSDFDKLLSTFKFTDK